MCDALDVRQAAELLPRLAPEFARQERALRVAAPTLRDEHRLEGALRAALLRLQVVVSRRTFVYLRWLVERDRRAPSMPARVVRRRPSPAARGHVAAPRARR